MLHIPVEKIEKEVDEIKNENPDIFYNQETLRKLIKENKISDTQLAFIVEVKNGKPIQLIHKFKNDIIEKLDNESYKNVISDIEIQFETNDIDIRKKLSEMIGLTEIPEFDPNAICELDGYLGKYIKDKIDPVELVKSVRSD